MKRHMAAVGIGFLVTSIYIGIVGVIAATSQVHDEVFGYGVGVFATVSAGVWLVLPAWQRRDGPP